MTPRVATPPTAVAQRGFSLVELIIAMLIALFLLGGLVTLVMGTRKTNATQTQLSVLQDNQRIAMTLITNLVQKAGYFPDPTGQMLSSFNAETLSTVSMAASQVLGGTYAAGVPDAFGVRFFAPANDTTAMIINCAGQSNTTASPNISYNNVFQIGTVNGTKWLQCLSRTNNNGTLGTVTTINLIPNVTSMSVLYGVSSSTAGDDYSIIQYLNASQMTLTRWLNVTAVKVTLTFQLPAYGSTGGQMVNCAVNPQCTTTLTKVISIMSRAGVNT